MRRSVVMEGKMACTRVEIGATARRESGPVVRMINDNGNGPVNLFEQHDTQQPVRKGHGAKAQGFEGLGTGFRVHGHLARQS